MTLKDKAASWVLYLLRNVGLPSVLPWSFRKLRSLYDGEPDRYLQLLRAHSTKKHWLNRFFAGYELQSVYHSSPDEVIDLLRELSSDDEEIVREGAAHSWSTLLEYEFESVFPILHQMREQEQFEVRYTSALAPVQYFDDHASEDERGQIRDFWKSFEDDPRQGLRNLVESQILDERT